ncbi:MAG: 5-(carboxyamino)imidazole ribonucleotide synthase, partial [Microcystaceae cyanobacterium]
LDLIVQTSHPDDPAVKIAADVILAVVDDAQATAQLASRCDVITFENEFINLEALSPLAEQGVCFRPSLETLSPLLDKYHQRCYLQKIGLPVPRFIAIQNSIPNSEFIFPVVFKARRHGYDGQGTYIIDTPETLLSTWKRLEGFPLMLEEFVPFEREIAVIAARSVTGDVVIYPVVETQQENQVCRRVIVPADIAPEISLQVEAIARHLLEQLKVVGVFGLELFLTADGQLVVNEIAPRTHNSGHYTLDACETSQFEMQLRAVTELPLGSPVLKSSGAVMVNLLGYEASQQDYHEKRAKLAAIPGAHVHWYGKTESRPGRKLGHVTVLLEQNGQDNQWLQAIETIWYGL